MRNVYGVDLSGSHSFGGIPSLESLSKTLVSLLLDETCYSGFDFIVSVEVGGEPVHLHLLVGHKFECMDDEPHL